MKKRLAPEGLPLPRTIVVIPTYRAEKTIADVIAGIPGWVAAIIVVDDASSDATLRAISEIDEARVHLVQHEVNRGVGGATVTGWRKALELGADIVVKMDADGQMDPRHLPALVTPIVLGQADATKGNRFTSRKRLAAMPFHRLIGNSALAFLSKWSSGYWRIFDPCNGYVAVSRTTLETLDLEALHPRFFFESSLLVELALAGAVVRDVPIEAVYRGERSHLSVVEALLKFPSLHLRYGLRRWLKQYFLLDFSIASLYLLIGVPLTLVGVVHGAARWIEAIETRLPTPTGTVVLVAVMVIVGLQFVLQGIAFDIGRTPSRPLEQNREIDFDEWWERRGHEGAMTSSPRSRTDR